MKNDIEKLGRKVERFCLVPSPLFLKEGRELLRELLFAYCGAAELPMRNRLAQMIGLVRSVSGTDAQDYVQAIHSIAFEAYANGEDDTAEFLFRKACELNSSSSISNNLAYVMRRKRTDPVNSGEIISLLLPGVREREPFCMINMGLLFALSLSAPGDWRTADALFSLLPDNPEKAAEWWQKLGRKGETEGLLVHFFLLRHAKISRSELGTVRSLAHRLKRSIRGFPVWLAGQYAAETLDDVLECADDEYFGSMLEEYLDKLPPVRESADNLMQAARCEDIPQIYEKLLTDFSALLTAEETEKLKAEYGKRFSAPPSDEAE